MYNAEQIIYTSDILGPPLPMLPRAEIFTLYLPTLRAISLSDDIAEAFVFATAMLEGGHAQAAESRRSAKQRRSTRLSGNAYKRHIEWQDAEIADMVATSGFPDA